MSGSEYFDHTTYPSVGAAGSSSAMRAELDLIEAGFGKLPDLSGNGGKVVAINSGATALEAITTTGTGSGVRATSPALTTPNIGVATANSVNKVAITAPASAATLALADGSTLATSGANSATLTTTGSTNVTLPTSGTLATLAQFSASSGSSLVGFIQAGASAVLRIAQAKMRDIVNVKDFGATGDGATDDTASILAAIAAVAAAAEPNAAGVVYFSAGTYRTSAPITLPSNVVLRGDGFTNTFIKPLNSAVFSAAQAVVMTTGFTEDANLWDYYSPYPAGLKMGVQIHDLCIDGNRANVANANGLMIYGGKWVLRNVAVISTSGHGIWTECGSIGASTTGDDLHDFLNMHESFAENVYIVNADKHGWLYRGPNDSYIDNVQIKTCGWGGFIQDADSTISTGNLEIGSLHVYACLCGHANGYQIELNQANARFIYCDASRKGGTLVNAATVITHFYAVENGAAAAVGAGDYWSLKALSTVQIGAYRETRTTGITSGTLGGSLWLSTGAEDSKVGNIRIVEASATTVASVGIKIDVDRVGIMGGVVQTFDQTGGVGLELNSSGNMISLQLRSCTTGVDYNNSGKGRNQLRLNFLSCTTDIDIAAAVAASDSIDATGDTGAVTVRKTQANTGRLQLQELTATPADPSNGAAANLYVKDDKLIIQFQDAGTVRYKYLDLTGTGVTWTHTTSAP